MSFLKHFSTVILTGLLAAAPFVSTQAATYTSQEQANMKLVADFYAALDKGDADGNLKQKIRGIAEKYLKEDYIQHAETAGAFGQGREGLIHMFEQMPSRPAPAGAAAPPPATVVLLSAQGDLVIRVSSRVTPPPAGTGRPSIIFNMFRVQDGKLAEHWDSSAAGTQQGAPAAGAPGASEKPR